MTKTKFHTKENSAFNVYGMVCSPLYHSVAMLENLLETHRVSNKMLLVNTFSSSNA